MDYSRRLKGLQEKMVERGVDLVVFGSCQNFQYLTGLSIGWRRGVDLMYDADNIFVPREGKPILTLSRASLEYEREKHAREPSPWIKDIRILEGGDKYDDIIKHVVKDVGLEGGRVALGEHLWGSTILKLFSLLKGVEFCSGEDLMDHLRMIKEPSEVEAMRNVANLTDEVMEKIVSGIRDGVTMRELQLEIEITGRKSGASDRSFSPSAGFVKSGSEPRGLIRSYKMNENLEPDTAIWFDVGFVLDGYCSDWGRSVFWGVANREVADGYEALQRAVVETIEKIQPEVTRVNEIFPSIEASLDKDGYGKYLRARLPHGSVGHQIGVEVHEPPWLKPENDNLFKPGMVFCVEPKLWHDGEYYLRVEDVVHITKSGAEFLTAFDRELFQL